MKVSVWDTYVKREDGKIMHFDILVPNSLQDEQTILNYGASYLKSKAFKTESISSNICNFCHIEQATDAVMNDIQNKGFSIIEMENCN
ncbi:DUF2024 family protein [Hwangdonia lutea]|uniref:DUF2024 family protein n=1 Tax=Hwangdonia lutea TaxID=3075823 RepID=A0AA97EPF7_9FLAO|nr:DUF2024 family protein [Hwangdonia sp. SCSIO 19198]WOD44661.1 DUF2024 family protein [Hwangdonia sp. SCSIO 19198]